MIGRAESWPHQIEIEVDRVSSYDNAHTIVSPRAVSTI